MHRHPHALRVMPLVFILFLFTVGNSRPVHAQDRHAEIEALKQQVEDLRRREHETQRQLEALQRRLDRLQSQPAATTPKTSPASALDQAVQELESASPPPTRATQPSLLSQPVGGATLRLIDISADILIGLAAPPEAMKISSCFRVGGTTRVRTASHSGT